MESFSSSSTAKAKHHSLCFHNKVFHMQYRLGKGSYGYCFAYVSHHEGGLKEQVAVKIMRRKMEHCQEVLVHRTLLHPNIVHIIHHMESKHHLFLVMEKCQRTLLSVFQHESAQWKVPRIRTVFKGVLSALVYLHGQQYVHRDIKLSNLLLNDECCVKLCDFGCVSRIGDSMSNVCGTVSYMSPESIRRSLLQVHPCLDVWSVGCCLFTFLNGHQPFVQSSRDGTMQRILLGLHEQSAPEVLAKGGAIRLIRLLDRMFESNCTTRITSTELLADPFFADDSARFVDNELLFPDLHQIDSHIITMCQDFIRKTLIIQNHLQSNSALRTSRRKSYSLRYIVKHSTFAGKRLLYALSDGSYAMLFGGSVTVLRARGSSANRIINHHTGNRDKLAEGLKIQTLDAFHEDMVNFFASTPAVPVERTPVEFVIGYLRFAHAMVALFSNKTMQIVWDERLFFIRNFRVGVIVGGHWRFDHNLDLSTELNNVLTLVESVVLQ